MDIKKEKLVLKTDSGLPVPCELAFPEEPKAFVIITHGFGSSKESSTAQMMLKDLPPAGFGAIAYDLPAHGSADAADTPLSCENCMDHLRTVESYIAERFVFPRIFFFSSSFGAYITLLSFSKHAHLGDRLFLRSAAVNMPELFAEHPEKPGNTEEPWDEEYSREEIMSEIDRQGYYVLELADSAPVRITRQFLDDMNEGDLFAAASRIPFDEIEVMMVHGEKDRVIDPEAAKNFAAENNIPLTMMAGEVHTLSADKDSPAKVSQMAIRFFSGNE